jgi:iron complex outermembrane receptor protein
MVFSSQYKNAHSTLTFGGTTRYDGNHFGKIISTTIVNAAPSDYEYYRLNAHKKEISVYSKWTHKIDNNWSFYGDLQLRNVNYVINGFEDNPNIIVNNKYLFFKSKAGITDKNKTNKIYFSIAKAAKEPES